MVDLNDLTIAYLEKLAKEFNISIKKSSNKAEKIKKIEEANIPGDLIEKLLNKYLSEKAISQKDYNVSRKDLEERVNNLENQVELLINALSELKENQFKGDTQRLINKVNDIEIVKRIILSLIIPGKSITIDDLIGVKELQKYPLYMITQAIIDLMEEDALIGAEGKSMQKIGGKIGLLIRK